MQLLDACCSQVDAWCSKSSRRAPAALQSRVFTQAIAGACLSLLGCRWQQRWPGGSPATLPRLIDLEDWAAHDGTAARTQAQQLRTSAVAGLTTRQRSAEPRPGPASIHQRCSSRGARWCRPTMRAFRQRLLARTMWLAPGGHIVWGQQLLPERSRRLPAPPSPPSEQR